MFKQLRKLFKANLAMTFRDKSVWFWSIFYPVLLLVIFMLLFGRSSESDFKAKVAMVASGNGQASEQMLAGLQQIPVFEWKDKSPVSREKAEQWVKDKDIDAAIILPEQAGDTKITLVMNKEKENSSTHMTLRGIIENFIQTATYQQANVKPLYTLATEFVTIGSEKLQFIDFLMTGMIALAISQAGMFGMVTMMEMRRNGVLKRLMLTPMSMKMYGMSNVFVRFLISIIQIVLLTLIGIFGFGATLHLHITAFIVMFAVGTIAFAAVGFMIAAFSKSTDSYFGIANLSSFIMMFLSGIFFEVGSLPDFIKPISAIMPLTYFVNGVRDTMVYGNGFLNGAYWLNLGILAAWAVVTFAIASRLYRWTPDKR